MDTLYIRKIKQGIVIDHIKTGKGIMVVEIIKKFFNLDTSEISIGINYESSKIGRKDLVKISGDIELPEIALQHIAVMCGNLSVKKIDNYEVVKKFKLDFTEKIIGIVRCLNPKCVTNVEKITTRFTRIETGLYKCEYCEKTYQISTITGE